MNLAYLKSSVVVFIAPEGYDVGALDYDTTQDATGANIGDTWDGSQYVRPAVPTEQKNAATMIQQFQVAFAQFETLETTVTARALTAVETRQAWALMARTLKNLIRYVKQDFTSVTPPTGPDERKAP